jgi:hypothetical protein
MVRIYFGKWKNFTLCPGWWRNFVKFTCKDISVFDKHESRDKALTDGLAAYNAVMIPDDSR